MNKNRYILITAAKNEEKYIGNTLMSVTSQTILPLKWIIINDGSTDNTAQIISDFQKRFSFIELVNNPINEKRNFASQANLINLGFEKIKDIDFDFVSTLDADITFEKDYYENILSEFSKNAKLGIGGGSFYEFIEGVWKEIPMVKHSVRGAVQFFRYKCFSDMGKKLVPLRFGGFDTVAEVLARKNGWEVRTFNNYKVYHHRRTGTGGTGIYKARFRGGLVEHSVGYHPLYQFLKCINRLREKPYVIGSVLRFAGFWWATIKNVDRQLDAHFIQHHKAEQLRRIRTRFFKS